MSVQIETGKMNGFTEANELLISAIEELEEMRMFYFVQFSFFLTSFLYCSNFLS